MTKSKSVLMLCALALLAGTVSGASAQPLEDRQFSVVRHNTILGPTGLLTVPTAFVTPYRQGQLGTSFSRDLKSITANYGLLSGIEVGAAFIDEDAGSNDVLGNAKLHIVPSNIPWMELGIGVMDVTDEIERTGYIIASADWTVPSRLQDDAIGFRLHAGAGSGIFHDKFIGGAELRLNPRLGIIGEWDTENFNTAVRYTHNDALRLQLGIVTKRVFFGVTYGMSF